MADSKISALTDGGAVQAGDQFVVARSGADKSILGAGVGAVLAAVQYAPSTLSDYSVTTTGTPAALDTTNLTASFTVPPSGNVIVRFSASMKAANLDLGFALLNHSGGAQLGKTLSNVMAPVTSAQVLRLACEWLLTGQTPGATLGIDIAAGISAAGTAHVYAMGHTGAVNDSKVGPALIVVQAA